MINEIILKNLFANGVRVTLVRKEILSHIVNAHHPVSVPEIIKSLRSKKVNKTTVYRFIEVLLEQKIIKKVFISPERVCYESNFLPHHHHITCTTCGMVDEVTSPKLEEAIHSLENDVSPNYKVSNHVIEFYGVCKTCQ